MVSKLVVDTNILFSFFRENPVRFVIVNSKSFGLQLLTPEYAFEELWNNKAALVKYSSLKEEELKSITETLKSFIEVVDAESFRKFKAKAMESSPDEKDVPFFALALKLKAKEPDTAIWSNEQRLKQQLVVKVFSTSELLAELGLK